MGYCKDADPKWTESGNLVADGNGRSLGGTELGQPRGVNKGVAHDLVARSVGTKYGLDVHDDDNRRVGREDTYEGILGRNIGGNPKQGVELSIWYEGMLIPVMPEVKQGYEARHEWGMVEGNSRVFTGVRGTGFGWSPERDMTVIPFDEVIETKAHQHCTCGPPEGEHTPDPHPPPEVPTATPNSTLQPHLFISNLSIFTLDPFVTFERAKVPKGPKVGIPFKRKAGPAPKVKLLLRISLGRWDVEGEMVLGETTTCQHIGMLRRCFVVMQRGGMPKQQPYIDDEEWEDPQPWEMVWVGVVDHFAKESPTRIIAEHRAFINKAHTYTTALVRKSADAVSFGNVAADDPCMARIMVFCRSGARSIGKGSEARALSLRLKIEVAAETEAAVAADIEVAGEAVVEVEAVLQMRSPHPRAVAFGRENMGCFTYLGLGFGNFGYIKDYLC
ncbi:hypothetical protein F5887DRAFT_922286 [Amanita rubescens]|nr:hypothetical protein F5887DRAFT_922286 [Amanita rubescens]